MSDALFSAVDLARPSIKAGWRLQRLEVLNWGTFHGRAWTLTLDGTNTLLTGDIGSGKSTLVDAVTTLLLPANKIAYNKAAGAEGKERDLRSYVLGHYKSERIESTGTSRPVGLRDHRSYSVLLGVFRNDGFDEEVTLAQVFTQRDRSGQPDRFFVTAARGLSIEPDFADFGTDLNALRRRLRTSVGASVDKDFPAYGRAVRRLLGITSEQALELFHQTVSMKSVGNLNEFVRTHMLEHADAGEKVAAVVTHFDDLTRAHDAVRRAQDQLAALDPLLVNCDKHAALDADRRATGRQRDAVGLYFTERRRHLLTEVGESLETTLVGRRAELDEVVAELEAARATKDQLVGDRASAGGDRVADLEREIKDLQVLAEDRRKRLEKFHDLLDGLAMEPVEDPATFAQRRVEVTTAYDATRPLQRGLDDEFAVAMTRRSRLQDQIADVRADLDSLAAQPSNIPRRSLALRERLARDLDLSLDDLPFVGELVDVADDHAPWRGAAERVLRGFGLSLLVGQRLYPAVAQWVNDHHLGAKLVYHRVPDRQVPVRAEQPAGLRLVDTLVVESGPHESFLRAALTRRADHVCADSLAIFQAADRAVTREGQVRSGDQHEKDDRSRVDDPTGWVLGRSNLAKIAALEVVLATLDVELSAAESTVGAVQLRRDEVRARGEALSSLTQYESWSELDTATPRRHAAEAAGERDRLLAGSSRLAEIDRSLAAVARQITTTDSRRSELEGAIGGLTTELAAGRRAIAVADAQLNATPHDVLALARAEYPRIEARLDAPVTDADACDREATTLASALSRAMERQQQQMNGIATTAQQQMASVKDQWPAVTTEMDASIEAASEYHAFRDRVRRDDLPRFEAEFKHQLNTNTIRELASLATWLRRQSDDMQSRVDRINESLGAIDYSPGRYIELVVEPTVNDDVRQFRGDLREVTAGALEGDDQYSEQRFLDVKRIVDRLRGRDGHAEADRVWARRVTDVRNWHTFSAAEIDKETGTEWEHYRDSDGKSGGQKEKLAYTILAASLAYQFGLDWGVQKSRDFRFAVIDEAFGRGSDISTRYALSLFERLGLQLLIVTPLQKVHVIEPYVSAIGFVDNRDNRDSRVQTLTIEEFRARRDGTAGRND